MHISIIIVNYNTADLISACIDSVLQQRKVNFEIIVVENASQDHSLEVLRNYQDKIHLIVNSENIGFARACNQGFHKSRGDYIYLLNPDAQLTNEDDLYHLMLFAKAHPEVGLTGTRIVNADGSAGPYFIPKKYPGEKYMPSELKLPGTISYLLCASAFIPRTVYTKVSGFDEDFFVYGEDMDICLRIRKQGLSLAYYDKVTIKHIGNASERDACNYQRYLRRIESLYIFYKKHYAEADVKKLLKKDLVKACFRLTVLNIKKRFAARDGKLQAKIARYRAITLMARKYLKDSL